MGCESIEDMAQIAMDETVDQSIRAQMYKELAGYVAPKKAVKMRGGSGVSLIDLIRAIDQHGGSKADKGDT